MLSGGALRRWGAGLALGLSLSLGVWADPDEVARHFPASTEFFLTGRVLPTPHIFKGFLARLESNPGIEALIEQIPVPTYLAIKDDVLPWVEGRMTVAWVRLGERSPLEAQERREYQESAYRAVTSDLRDLGIDVEKFQRRTKRLPKDFKELVARKLRVSEPLSPHADFKLVKSKDGWSIETTYKGSLGMAELCDPPRYVSGQGLVEATRKPRPPFNLVVALKCADEALARKTMARLVENKLITAIDAAHWQAPLDDASPWIVQIEGGWVVASDNQGLLKDFAAPPTGPGLTGNPHYRLQREQLACAPTDDDIFAFVDLDDLIRTTTSLGDLPPIARVFTSMGIAQKQTPNLNSGLPPTTSWSEVFVEVQPPGNVTLAPAPSPPPPPPTPPTADPSPRPSAAPQGDPSPPVLDPWSFLAPIPAQSSVVYAVNVAEVLHLLQEAGKWDPEVETLWGNLYAQLQKALESDVSTADLARATGWAVMETEVFDEIFAAVNDVRTAILTPGDIEAASLVGQLSRLPGVWSVQLSDPTLQDKLASSLWSAVGDKSMSHQVGKLHYWLREDGNWTLARLPQRLAATGRVSKRLLLRSLLCSAGQQPALSELTSWHDFRGHLKGRPIFFTHQKIDWIYSVLKGLLLAWDSQMRPYAEILGRYRDSYGAVCLEPRGLRGYAAFYSTQDPIPSAAPAGEASPQSDLIRLQRELASHFRTRRTLETKAAETPSASYRDLGQLTACKSNLKNVATALEMYSTDNAGHYPKSLKQLTPDYLRRIPTCPAADKDTYSARYRVSTKPDRYSVYCSGHNHKACKIPMHRPAFNSEQGLIEK